MHIVSLIQFNIIQYNNNNNTQHLTQCHISLSYSHSIINEQKYSLIHAQFLDTKLYMYLLVFFSSFFSLPLAFFLFTVVLRYLPSNSSLRSYCLIRISFKDTVAPAL